MSSAVLTHGAMGTPPPHQRSLVLRRGRKGTREAVRRHARSHAAPADAGRCGFCLRVGKRKLCEPKGTHIRIALPLSTSEKRLRLSVRCRRAGLEGCMARCVSPARWSCAGTDSCVRGARREGGETCSVTRRWGGDDAGGPSCGCLEVLSPASARVGDDCSEVRLQQRTGGEREGEENDPHLS